eukprot:TRINITY_DN37591_c0_g1_i1.p1 TRINITY_DN37591_c0_g1~~TRINITY_DN37591_c0_g1_i1.p1  ORF type:complete len:420 (-),score=61.05 TRINITY_DN37591_c0_g1_i1:176-1435(-)
MDTRFSTFLLILAFLITGAVNTLSKKFQFQTCSFANADAVLQQSSIGILSAGCPSGERLFKKPWTQNLLMFFGESLVYVYYLYRRRMQYAKDSTLLTPLASLDSREASKRAPFYAFMVPACCDVLGTGLGGVGMLYISASVWQMMKGSVIVFTSILSVVCLGRKLHCYNWVAVFVSVCGLTLVGASAVLDGGDTSSDIVLGIGFTVLSQFFCALQMVSEELFVKKYKAPPEQVVGSEGLWGMIIMVMTLCVMDYVPGKDAGGSFENAIDSFRMISNSDALFALVMVYVLSLSCANFLGVTISKNLSALHRMVNDALRAVLLWGVQLGLYYVGSDNYGQGPTAHSWMQLVGFLFMIMGALINHEVIKMPSLSYSEQDELVKATDAASDPTSQTPRLLAHPGTSLQKCSTDVETKGAVDAN